MTSTMHNLRDRLSRIVARIGLAAYLIGSAASVIAANPVLFHRFGSLGVAAAILFFTDRLMQIELRRQRSVERILHEFGVELEVMKSGVEAKDVPNEGYVIDYLTEERQFDTLRARAEMINTFNVLLLSVATLQWGFGEPFLNWMVAP